jgi:hypothetical protein
MEENKFVVVPLLFLALFSMLFMFQVSYSGASFQGQERPFPEIFSPRQISPAFDETITIIADNLHWSFSTAAGELKSPLLSFLGLEDYRFAPPNHSVIVKVDPMDWSDPSPQVLGASIEDPYYTYYYEGR